MKNRIPRTLLFLIIVIGCNSKSKESKSIENKFESQTTISKESYSNKLQGFWLGQCIANWTGLVTEMDKIGNIGEIKTGAFYTRDDWGKPDLPSIWNEEPSEWSSTIDFVFRNEDEVWGADDDTDIEYIYQYLMHTNKTSLLTPEQIKEGWLRHIKHDEENYLWVSNQKAFDLMMDGFLPPETSSPENNEHFEMIDAQLTTEIFGLFAPTKPQVALKISDLPIRTTARYDAEYIAKFYVYMHALALTIEPDKPIKDQLFQIAEKASSVLPDTTYSSKMFGYVKGLYKSGISWERARDSIYAKYQVRQEDGYDITSQNLYCNGCFAGGINFAASLVSLFYGEGDLTETIKIGTLAGWDSDNPTATWGGLLGFILGKEGVEKEFNRSFSNRYNIHRTRQNFPNNGMDTFEHMAEVGLEIIDSVVTQQMNGKIDAEGKNWIIPNYHPSRLRKP